MTWNSKAVAARNIIFRQNRVRYKLKLNNNRCVKFSLSCIRAAKKSMCLQPRGEFTKTQRADPKAEDWVWFLVLVIFCCFGLVLSYTVSLTCCLVPFSTEKAWEMVTHNLLGQTQQWCELAEASAKPLKVSFHLDEES